MTRRLLAELVDRNEAHANALDGDSFADCRDGQHPPVVSVCCSDSRVSQTGMWDADRPGFLFTAGNIGNRVCDVVDGERVLDGSVAYPLAHADTTVVAVVGHTGCGAVGAALAAAETGEYPTQPGVRADVEELVPIVEDGLDHPAVDSNDSSDSSDPSTNVRNQLVEFNVHEQVARVRETDEAADADVYGFVYDFHQAYGDRDGVAYLVNANGERDPAALRDLLDDADADRAVSLL